MEETYNPIREEERPRIGLFNRVSPRPGFALVLQREGHPLVVLRRTEDHVTLGERLWGNHLRLYWIDMSEHALEIRCQLPATTDAFSFSAVVHLRCAVEDPVTAIDRQITDVRMVLQDPVIDVMRGASRAFSVDQSADAEREVAAALRERLAAPDFCSGMRVGLVAVKLDLEDAARKHVRDLMEHDRRHAQDTHQADLRHQRELQETKLLHEREVAAARLLHAAALPLALFYGTAALPTGPQTRQAVFVANGIQSIWLSLDGWVMTGDLRPCAQPGIVTIAVPDPKPARSCVPTPRPVVATPAPRKSR